MGILDKINKPKAEPRKKETKKQSDAKSTETKTSMQSMNANSNAHAVVLRPRMSEKALIGESSGVYVFEIAANATKIDVKHAIKDLYGITPTTVRVVNIDGKKIRFGARIGRRNDWKKAIVTLPKGKTISIHEGV